MDESINALLRLSVVLVLSCTGPPVAASVPPSPQIND